MNLVLNPSEIHSNGIKYRYVFDCPKCQVCLNHRVHRSKMMKLFLGWLPIRKYRCLKCLQVCYVLSSKSTRRWTAIVGGGRNYHLLVPQSIKLDTIHGFKVEQ